MKCIIIALCLFAFWIMPMQAETYRETLMDPHILAIQSRTAEILNNVQQTEMYQTCLQQYQTAVSQILSGGEMPADMSVPAEISDAYATAFRRYYTESQTDQAVMTCFRLMTQTLDEKVMNEIAAYTDRNLPTVLMAVCVQTQPVEDMKEQPMELAVALITRISDWIHLYYPQYNTPRQ